MLRERRSEKRDGWMKHARESEMKELNSVVVGIERNDNAGRAGLTFSWNQVHIEEMVNTMKTHKRLPSARHVCPPSLQTAPSFMDMWRLHHNIARTKNPLALTAEGDLLMINVQHTMSGTFRSTEGATVLYVICRSLSTMRKQGRSLLTAMTAVCEGSLVPMAWEPGARVVTLSAIREEANVCRYIYSILFIIYFFY